MARTNVQVLGTDGKPLRHLTQWDCNREMVIKGLPAFTQQTEIHYWDRDRYRAIVVPAVSVDGGIQAKIPNILLQNADDVVFTVFFRSAENRGESVFIHNIPVFRATKPEDYTWTENIDYISFTELIKEAEALLDLLNAAGDNVILISQRALEEAAKAAAAAEEAQRLAAEFADQIADLPNKQNWATVKMDNEPAIDRPSRLQSYFFALRKSPNRVYQFEIAKDKNQNIVTACGGVPDGLDPDAPAFITVALPYSEAGGFVEHIEYRMRKSGDVRCKDYSTTHDTESASWYDSGWYDPEGKGVFFAEYEVTSFQDILAAFKAGKNIWLKVRGRRFMPLLETDDAVDPQIFTFLLSYGMFRARVDVGLQNGETHWKSADIETSASDISAKVPIPGAKQNIQAYLDYLNKKLVTIDVEVRGENSFWTDPLTTGKQIIDMINAGKEVRLHFFDTVTNTGDQLYAYETTVDGVPYFRRNVVSPDEVSRINIGVQYNGEIKFTNVPYTPPIQTAYAVCYDEAAPASTTGNTWYVPKTMPKPSGNVGMMLDVRWEHGQVNSLGYDVRLVWGDPGEPDNVEIIGTASTTDSLTGSHSIPTEGTVRYQLEEVSGRKRWRYVSGTLIPTQFSTATAAATADKVVPGLALGYLPGMEIYVQMDAGNTADLMRLVPDEGATLPVYGNGEGAATGEIQAGYILHLKNAGDHWQIINQPGGSPDAVLTTPQELTEEQKKQARENISALPVGLGVAGASVGDLMRVKEVDGKGVPTALEAIGLADLAEKWEKIAEVKIKEPGMLLIDRDSKGQPFRLTSAALVVHAVGNFAYFRINLKTVWGGLPVEKAIKTVDPDYPDSWYVVAVIRSGDIYLPITTRGTKYHNETAAAESLSADTFRKPLNPYKYPIEKAISLDAVPTDSEFILFGVRE